MVVAQKTMWTQDVVPGYEAATLPFPDDYDGKVVATLVRHKPATPTRKAVLYVHGFIDYFFQEHLAEQYNAHGYNFYALELRKYGRSLLDKQHPNFCKSITEYYPEITAAIDIITGAEGNTYLVANGHSTGGLIMSLYASDGPLKRRIDSLFLNSPFFDFNVSPGLRRISGIIAGMGAIAPFLTVPGALSPLYAQSLHRDHKGEWQFSTKWKPIEGFPAYLGWLRAIRQAHARVRAGLSITCPVLVMHSDKSVYGKEWNKDFLRGDAVLNVAHIREGSRQLGSNVTVMEINDGLHDLTLSRKDVREELFGKLFGWLGHVENR